MSSASAILLGLQPAPFVQSAIRHLQVTARERRWIANLYSNVFCAEREIALCGPAEIGSALRRLSI